MVRTLADSSFWLALVMELHPFHQIAKAWLAKQAEEDVVLFCRSTQQSLLRLLTTAAVLRPYEMEPLNCTEAWQVYTGLVHGRNIRLEMEPPGVEEEWYRLTARETASPKLWMDAYLAAFAAQGGYDLVTADAGFRQFDGVPTTLLQG
jgi:uncharacterized protein